MNERVELLQANGFGVVEDGSAVIVISSSERQQRTSSVYSENPTIARRYESVRIAVRILLPEIEEAGK